MIVQKYGGTSVATTEKIAKVANNLKCRLETEEKIVVVLSAMSGETDALSGLGKSMAATPNLRELDQLVSIGENKTISLLGLALGRLGVRAISLTGWQAGIITTTKFSAAQIKQIKVEKLQKYFKNFDVVIVAGFQGITQEGDITTLGKGGSDTTAVALAGALGCVCEIYTDVPGVLAADPKLLPHAKKLDVLSYDELMEMSASGAKVMETRSVEIAKKYGVPLFIGQSLCDLKEATKVLKQTEDFEKVIVKNITAKDDVKVYRIDNLQPTELTSVIEILQNFSQKLDLFSVEENGENFNIKFLVDKPLQKQIDEKINKICEKKLKNKHLSNICKITLVGSGFKTHTEVLQDLLKALQERNIFVSNLMLSEVSIGFTVPMNQKMAAVFALAKQFDLEDAYKINLAIVGATGMVGKTFLNVLAESKIKHQIENLYLFASAESAGKTIKFENQEFEVLELNEQNILSHKIDYAFFSAGEDVSKKFAPIFAQNQAVVIDNSSAFRMEKDIPLIVPEVNFENTISRIIANPNCSTIQVMLPLYALKKHFGLARVDFATYQAVSGSGEAGVQDLHVTAKGENPNFYPHPIFNNCLPHIGSFGDNGFSSEEMKMINETHKILNDESIEISATCVRVPVENCHCVAVSVTLHVEADLHEVHNVLRAQEGLEILDLPKDNVYPINQIANGKDAVFVGRIRKDLYNPNMVHFWCVADNLRKGAAANGVQILKKLLQNK